MKRSVLLSVAIPVIALLTTVLFIGGCGRTQPPEAATATPVGAASQPTQPPDSPTPDSPTPTAEPTPERTATEAPPTATTVPTATPVPATATDFPPTATAVPTATPAPAAAQPATAPRGPAIVIDHRSVEDFDRIPDEYIQKASQLRLFLRHASVGQNLYDGLRCLANNFPDRRPNFCDRRLPPEQVIFDPKYDPNNWTFEPHAPGANPNPIWMNKVKGFIQRVNNPQPGEDFDVVTLTFDYVDLQDNFNMDDDFFSAETSKPTYRDLEALAAAHPDKAFVWWTSNLARGIGTPDSQHFNDQIRAYVAANGGVLFDMADIESYAPDGTLCTDNAGRGIPAICQDYTNEKQSGHLNSLGSQRVAKALWVLMARLAGWTG